MKIISYDLGTGGVKASVYDEKFQTLAKSFIEYPTRYESTTVKEQKPEDWWQGVIASTRKLLQESGTAAEEISCLALSGHSCVAVLLDAANQSLLEYVPIWSDTRAQEQTREFFTRVDEEKWYMTTGNGFPVACYSMFKLMWLKEHDPETFGKIHKVVGSKDYINLKLTGAVCTDHSYAASTGAYDLLNHRIDPKLVEAAGLPLDIFPEIVSSHTIVGRITREAAEEIGLKAGTAVACGGVDNACMALGAVGAQDGACYISLGSSSWIPINSQKPVLDFATKPYVFPHIDENMYTSAYSIFAGGSSYQWARDVLCQNLPRDNIYQAMDQLATQSPIGANGIIFNPSLAGGTSQDKSIHIRGAFAGLHLGTRQCDLLRAVLEGVTLNLKMSLDLLGKQTDMTSPLLICGGGSKSKFWMQMFADVFGMDLIRTNIDQDAASLGAAAICARAMKVWEDYSQLPKLHEVRYTCHAVEENHKAYEKVFEVFHHVSEVAADLGDYMYSVYQG